MNRYETKKYDPDKNSFEVLDDSKEATIGLVVNSAYDSTDGEIILSAPDAVVINHTGIPNIVYGDVDGDGMITPFDATLVLQHIVGMVTLEGRALKAADTDHDGRITPFDATLILQYIVGMITSLD
jgi:hypothetical protein